MFHHFQEGYDFIVGTSEHGETNISLSSSYLHLGIPSAYILDYHREKKTDLVVWMCNFFFVDDMELAFMKLIFRQFIRIAVLTGADIK